jgi:hypothetical protein
MLSSEYWNRMLKFRILKQMMLKFRILKQTACLQTQTQRGCLRTEHKEDSSARVQHQINYNCTRYEVLTEAWTPRCQPSLPVAVTCILNMCQSSLVRATRSDHLMYPDSLNSEILMSGTEFTKISTFFFPPSLHYNASFSNKQSSKHLLPKRTWHFSTDDRMLQAMCEKDITMLCANITHTSTSTSHQYTERRLTSVGGGRKPCGN